MPVWTSRFWDARTWNLLAWSMVQFVGQVARPDCQGSDREETTPSRPSLGQRLQVNPLCTSQHLRANTSYSPGRTAHEASRQKKARDAGTRRQLRHRTWSPPRVAGLDACQRHIARSIGNM